MLYFMLCLYVTEPQFHDNLMTSFNKRKWCKGIGTAKIKKFEFENTKSGWCRGVFT